APTQLLHRGARAERGALVPAELVGVDGSGEEIAPRAMVGVGRDHLPELDARVLGPQRRQGGGGSLAPLAARPRVLPVDLSRRRETLHELVVAGYALCRLGAPVPPERVEVRGLGHLP